MLRKTFIISAIICLASAGTIPIQDAMQARQEKQAVMWNHEQGFTQEQAATQVIPPAHCVLAVC
jgi:hypothetical protein